MTEGLKLPPLKGLAREAMKAEPPPGAIPERMHFSAKPKPSKRRPKPSVEPR